MSKHYLEVYMTYETRKHKTYIQECEFLNYHTELFVLMN